jgi:hypothetical protein
MGTGLGEERLPDGVALDTPNPTETTKLGIINYQ